MELISRTLAAAVPIMLGCLGLCFGSPHPGACIEPREHGVILVLTLPGAAPGVEIEVEAEMVAPYGGLMAWGMSQLRWDGPSVEIELAWAREISRQDRLLLALAPVHFRASLPGSAENIVAGTVTAAEDNDDAFQLVAFATADVAPGDRLPIRVIATHPVNGLPVPGVFVDTKIDQQRYTASTDNDGLAVLNPLVSSLPKSPLIFGSKNGFSDTTSIELPNRVMSRILVSSDRQRAAPGETIGARALVLDYRGRPVGGDQVFITVNDPQGRVVFRDGTSTDEHGVAASSWQIDDDAAAGDYTLGASLDCSRWYQQRVLVSRAQPPTLALGVTAVNGCVTTGVPASVSLDVTSPAGVPIPGALLSISYKGRDRTLWEGTSDDSGKARAVLAFEAERSSFERMRTGGRWQQPKRASVKEMVARAVDPITGRSAATPFSAALSYQAVHVYEASPRLHPLGLPLRLVLLTQRPDGNPVECVVSCRRRDGEIVAEGRSDRYGVVILESPEVLREEHDQRLEVSATDAEGRIGSLHMELAVATGPALRVMPAKVMHRPGEPLKADILSNQPSLDVIVEVVRNHHTIGNTTVSIENGRGSVEIDHEERFVGEVVLRAYAAMPPDLKGPVPADTASVVFTRSDRMTLTLDLEHHRVRAGTAVPGVARVDLGGTADTASVALAVVELDPDRRSARWLTDTMLGIHPTTMGYTNSPVVQTTSGPVRELAGLLSSDLPWLSAAAGLDQVAEVLLTLGEPVPIRSGQPGRIFAEANAASPVITVGDSDALWQAQAGFKRQMERLGEGGYHAFADWKKLHGGALPWRREDLLPLLAAAGLDIETTRDPWQRRLAATWTFTADDSNLTVSSAGMDGRFETEDDLRVTGTGGSWLRPLAEAMKTAAIEHIEKAHQWQTSAQEI
jgi:hypothetical protein